MKSLLPFVRYFVPVPLFYFRGLNFFLRVFVIPTNLHELSHKLQLFCNYCGPCSYFLGIRAMERRARLSFLYRFHIEVPVFFSWHQCISLIKIPTDKFRIAAFSATSLFSVPPPLPLLICDFLRLLFSLFVQISLFIIYRKQFRPTRRLHHTLLQKQ